MNLDAQTDYGKFHLLEVRCVPYEKSVHRERLIVKAHLRYKSFYLLTSLNHAHIYEWYVIRCGPKNGYQKTCVYKDWTLCAKHDNHFRFKNQHNLGGTHMPIY